MLNKDVVVVVVELICLKRSSLENDVNNICDSDKGRITSAIFKRIKEDIVNDKLSFSQAYTNSESFSSMCPEQFNSKRNPMVTAVVDSLASTSATPFKKAIIYEQLYSLTGPLSVSPFSFLQNLVIYSSSNSKIAVNLVGNTIPGGTYSTVKKWLDNISTKPLESPPGDCFVAFDNDQQ